MFHRTLSHRALLYTEMVTAAALVRGGATHLLDHDPAEHPVALQLGGADPGELAEAAAIGWAAGFREINLNVGCPSDRVQSGCFGAVLMRDPALVATCVAAMAQACAAEITVKCRIGVDDDVPAEVLPRFLDAIAAAGVGRVIVHARKAWLHGLSPKENREVPPLDYALARAMTQQFPSLQLSVNGGVTSLDQAAALLADGFDGVMVGRAAYHDPVAILGEADRRIFGAETPPVSREAAAHAMATHAAAHVAAGGRVHAVTRHMLGLFAGQPGARAWRRHLSTAAARPGAGAEVIEEALALLPPGNAAA